MVDTDPAISQDLFQVSIGDALSDVAKYGMQYDVLRDLRIFERHHRTDIINKSDGPMDHSGELRDSARVARARWRPFRSLYGGTSGSVSSGCLVVLPVAALHH